MLAFEKELFRGPIGQRSRSKCPLISNHFHSINDYHLILSLKTSYDDYPFCVETPVLRSGGQRSKSLTFNR